MKATGIVRRIDDLGRVVIPKEIRRGRKVDRDRVFCLSTVYNNKRTEKTEVN